MTTSAAGARIARAESGAASRVIPEWSLGDRLRKVRKVANLTQDEIAQKLGEKKSTYAAWELDTTSPRNVVAVAKRIEIATGVPAGWVLGIDQPTEPDGGTRITEGGIRINRGWYETAGLRRADALRVAA